MRNDWNTAIGGKRGKLRKRIGHVHVNEICVELPYPKRKRRRDRTRRYDPHTRNPRDWKLADFVFRSETRVGHQHVELDLCVCMLANLLKDGFHSADDGIVELAELQHFHTDTASFDDEAMESVKIRSKCPARSIGTIFCRIHSCALRPRLARRDRSSPRASMRAASALESSGGKSRPLRPSWTTSAGPHRFTVITGTPQAMASSTDRPRPSGPRLGWTSASSRDSTLGMSFLWPRNFTRSRIGELATRRRKCSSYS